MDISKALKIDGWMEKPELEWLAQQALQHRVIAEIGSYKGRSTRALADNTNGLVYAIDDFQGPREIEIANRDLIFQEFLKNMEGLEGRLNVLRCNHRYLPAFSFRPDMVFIDGSHEYEDVKADIQLWLSRLTVGGLICGHDYGWFAGVNNAVDELLPTRQIAPGTSIWYATII